MPGVWSQIGQALNALLRAATRPFAGLFPPSASPHAAGIDAFYIFLTGMSLFFSLLIAGCLAWFCWKYARGREADRSNPPDFNLPLELAWTGIPLVLCIGIFIWGARLYLPLFTPPGDGGGGGETIYIVGKQWMWKIQHPQGPAEIDALHAPTGSPLRLLMTSQDVIHDFSIPALRIKRDVLPGRYTTLWIQADRPGEFPIYCAEYCGTAHSAMRATLILMEPAAYARWLNRGEGQGESARAGAALFTSLGCSGCHANGNGTVSAPSLAGLFGKPVPLQGGGFAIADEAYLRESIYFPARKVVAGFAPLMPTFAGQIQEDQMLELIAYIRSLGQP